MKKILIFLCILFILSGTASAKIKKQIIFFDGSTKITSEVIGNESTFHNKIFFLTKQIFNNPEQQQVINLEIHYFNSWIFFTEDPFEINIDDVIYKTNKVNVFERGREYIIGTTTIDNELVEKILNGKRIIIRYHFSNNSPETWNVPTEVLNEWKEVIQATKL